jgi:hypothetical protein
MSDALRIECPRLKATVESLRKFGEDFQPAMARGMRGWAEQTRTDALRVTPKDLGTLRNTLFVDQKQQGELNIVTIGAGGPAAPYAVYVHENLKSNVHWKTPGTGPKYLENPIKQNMPKLDVDISKELDKELERITRA